MSLRRWIEGSARVGALLVFACGALALGLWLTGHEALLTLGLPGAPLMKAGSALGFVLGGLAVAGIGRAPRGRFSTGDLALPLLVLAAGSLLCVALWPQGAIAPWCSSPLLSLTLLVLAAACLRFEPATGRGLPLAVVACVAGVVFSGAVITAYAVWWLQSGEQLLLVRQSPQAALLQAVLALALGALCLSSRAAGEWRRQAALLAASASTALALVAAWALILANNGAGIAHDTRQRTDGVAQTLLEHMHRSLDPADLILRQIATRIDHQGLESYARSRADWQELHSTVASLRQISALVVLDRHGRVRSYSAQFPPDIAGSFVQREYFQAHQRGESVYLGPLIQTAAGKAAFTYSRRLNERNGAFAGVVLATLEVDYFRQFYRTVNLGQDGAVALVRTDGRMLLSEPAPPGGESVDRQASTLFKLVPGQERGSFVAESPFDHVQRFVAFRISGSQPLVVAASVSALPLAAQFERELFDAALLLTLALTVLVNATAQQLRARRRDARQQRQLEAGRAFNRAILDSVAATVAIIDRQGRVVDANKAWWRFAQPFGGSGPQEEPEGLEVLRRAGAGDAGLGALLRGIEAVMRQELPGFEINYACATPAPERWFKVRVTPLQGADGCVVLSQEDVTDLKLAEAALLRAQDELRRQASVDSLTSLLTRRRFDALAEQEIRQARHTPQLLTVLMVDLDHFKQINDRYGHPAGDAVLMRVAQMLRGVLRAGDLVSRFGGEEFVALLVGADEEEALRAATRLREVLGHLVVRHEAHEIRVTASVGISAWRPSEADLGPALERADQALYAAKAAGRDCSRVHVRGMAPPAGAPARSRYWPGEWPLGAEAPAGAAAAAQHP